MGIDDQPQNPYAAPVFPEPVMDMDVLDWHQNYQLIGPKLLCRSGLFLPEYCLVTGAADDLVPVPISLWAQSQSVSRYRRTGIGCLLCAPLSLAAAFLLIASGVAPGSAIAVTLTLTTPLLLIAGLILFLPGGRRRMLCRLHGQLHRTRQLWQRRLTMILGYTPLVFLSLRFAGIMERNWAVAAIAGIWGLSFLLGLVFLRGLRLRAVLLDEGLFEVQGFSGAFLRKLQANSDGQ